MEFEWDEVKREINKQKHGYDFDLAKVLLSGFHISRVVPADLHGEARFISMAEFNNEILIVIHTQRNNKQRIISIRKASQNERNEFRRITQN